MPARRLKRLPNPQEAFGETQVGTVARPFKTHKAAMIPKNWWVFRGVRRRLELARLSAFKSGIFI
jgi:hypothetical protein